MILSSLNKSWFSFPIRNSIYPLNDAPCFNVLMGVKITPGLKCNSYTYIYIIKKKLEKWSSLIGFIITRSQIRPKMKHWWHIWSDTAKSSHSNIDRLQNRLHDIVGDVISSTLQPLSHRNNFANQSLSCDKFYYKPFYLVLKVQLLTTRIRHVTSSEFE